MTRNPKFVAINQGSSNFGIYLKILSLILFSSFKMKGITMSPKNSSIKQVVVVQIDYILMVPYNPAFPNMSSLLNFGVFLIFISANIRHVLIKWGSQYRHVGIKWDGAY